MNINLMSFGIDIKYNLMVSNTVIANKYPYSNDRYQKEIRCRKKRIISIISIDDITI